MAVVHIYVSAERFYGFDDLRRFIDKTYSEDGEGIPSPFMREVELNAYDPGCIEAIASKTSVSITELLRDASYSQQWLSKLDPTLSADSAICVFGPNEVLNPTGCSLEYLGAFVYRP